MRQRLFTILYFGDVRPVEFGIGLMSALWGGWLLLPMKTFIISPTFREMARMAPEWTWGALFLTVGLLGLWMLLKGKLWWRRMFSYLYVGLWATLTYLYMSGDVRSTATISYGMVALGAAWVCIRLAIIKNANGNYHAR